MNKFIRAFAAALLGITIVIPAVVSAATLPRALVQTPVATCLNSASIITLKWDTLTGATSYSVFRNKSSTTWVNVSSKQISSSLSDASVSGGASYQYQVKTYFGGKATYSNIVAITAANCATNNPPASTPPPPPTSGEVSLNVYLTGYGWPDNTPPSAEISNPVIHQSAGGTGTYSDPITIAVGHSIIGGKDILDYPEGTRFYIPALRRYFIVEDTCGDGNSPQNGPCHTGYQGHVWLDAWVGGQNQNSSSVLACEDKITDFHNVIKNPASNYVVTSGPIFSGTCSPLFGDTVVTI